MTQQELNNVWAQHQCGKAGSGVACRANDKFEVVENVVSGRSWARPIGGDQWSEVKPQKGNAVSEVLREF